MNIVSDSRKASARKHANRSWTCSCGKVCRGNGGWSSHRRACAVHQAARAALSQPAFHDKGEKR